MAIDPSLKQCSKCAQVKSRLDFPKDRSKGDGLFSSCKACKNPMEVARQRANPAKAYEHTKNWREKNREAYNAKRNEWQKTENGKATKAAWIEKNRGKINLTNRLRSAMRRGMRQVVTLEYIQWLMKMQRSKCVACRADLRAAYHIDHVIALASGGTNNKTNLQLLCPACNCSKKTSHAVDFMQRKGFLL